MSLIVLVLVGLLPNPDSIANPYPYVVACSTNRRYVRVSPDPLHPTDRKKAVYTAYAAVTGSQDQELWSMTGWYSYYALLHNDGEHFVSFGVLTSGLTPSHEDVAVAFYENGVELASYSTADLISDSISSSGYRLEWLMYPYPSFGNGADDDLVRVLTCEGVEHVFNSTTGSLVASHPSVPLDLPLRERRSLRDPPPESIGLLPRLRRSWHVLLLGAGGGLALGLGIAYSRWRKQERAHDV
jgi:hypothetical protein